MVGIIKRENKEVTKITLKIPENILILSGVEYGEDIYREQILANLYGHKDIEVHLPKHIITCTSSFIEGIRKGNLKGDNRNTPLRFESENQDVKHNANKYWGRIV